MTWGWMNTSKDNTQLYYIGGNDTIRVYLRDFLLIHICLKNKSKLFQDMIYICVYMYDLLMIINDNFKNHTDTLYDVLIYFKNTE